MIMIQRYANAGVCGSQLAIDGPFGKCTVVLYCICFQIKPVFNLKFADKHIRKHRRPEAGASCLRFDFISALKYLPEGPLWI